MLAVEAKSFTTKTIKRELKDFEKIPDPETGRDIARCTKRH